MKRLLLTLLVSSGLYGASVEDLTFTLNDGDTAYAVSDCLESASGSLEIPSTYNGLPVTSIGDNAFYNSASLSSINIPDGVTSIGRNAFQNCSSLNQYHNPRRRDLDWGMGFRTVPVPDQHYNPRRRDLDWERSFLGVRKTNQRNNP